MQTGGNYSGGGRGTQIPLHFGPPSFAGVSTEPMARLIYTLVFYLMLPAILLRLMYRAWRAPAYARRWRERFGWFDWQAPQGGLWVHAVSVGETIAAVPLIRALQQIYPDLPILVTTMTPTGSERVRALLGDSVQHVYAPYDLPGAIQRFLRKVRPCAL